MHEYNTALPVSRGAPARGAGTTPALRAAPATRRHHRTRARTRHLPLADQVRELPYGELTVTLYASAMPATARRDYLSAEQIEAWPAEGLTSLGAAQVWALSYRSRAGTGAEGHVIWPLRRRHVLAHDLAHHYLVTRERWGYRRPASPRVEINEPAPEPGSTYLDFAARYERPQPLASAGGAR